MANDLAKRVKQNETQRKQGDGGKPSMMQLIDRMKPEIERALPKHLDAERVARIATTLVNSNPQLAKCTSESFLGALMTASQLGLEPGPLGEAYLVPYGQVCTFIPGYRGLIKLAWQSNQVKHIDAQVVHSGDDFDYAYGLDPFLHHKPTRGQRGEITEVYACATFHNGGSAFVVLSIDDVEAIRKRSKASKSGPWVTDWEQMAKKTAIKQMMKFVPLSTELRSLGQAAELDGSQRDATPGEVADVDDVIPQYIDADTVDDTDQDDSGEQGYRDDDPDMASQTSE